MISDRELKKFLDSDKHSNKEKVAYLKAHRPGAMKLLRKEIIAQKGKLGIIEKEAIRESR